MLTQINRIKLDSIFKDEKNFFVNQKEKLVKKILEYIITNDLCKYPFITQEEVAHEFYDALFSYNKEFYSQHLSWLKENHFTSMQILSSLMYELLAEYIQEDKTKEQLAHMTKTLNSLQKNIANTLVQNEKPLELLPYVPKNPAIHYLHNMYKLERDIRFITHSKLGTAPSFINLVQIGSYSAIIKVSHEQLVMLKDNCTSFILKNLDDEKNFSVRAKILSDLDSIVLIDDLKELESYPLLSRKYPRASIIHASLVYIANENEYISGNMLDISEGGIGIMSSSSGDFEKGQDIVAFISYEDEANNFKFSFEANGIITSIIGKKNAFRYGIQLFLDERERQIVSNLVNILNRNKKSKE
ncbi:PilZ domain-containing protein [Sulfurospirillum sp. 1307]|jgi:hypothetical protein